MTDFLTADTNLPSYMMFPRFPSGHGNKRNCQNALYYPARPGKAFPKNEGWSDIDGHVFIYFTIEALAEVLHKKPDDC